MVVEPEARGRPVVPAVARVPLGIWLAATLVGACGGSVETPVSGGDGGTKGVGPECFNGQAPEACMCDGGAYGSRGCLPDQGIFSPCSCPAGDAGAADATVADGRAVDAAKVACAPGDGPVALPGGAYFFLVNITVPVTTQLQLWSNIVFDAPSGGFVGSFSNADRNLDLSRCSLPCTTSDACRTLPSPECVPPSTRADGVDEYPDWRVNTSPPLGYSIDVSGCARAVAPQTAIVSLPTTLEVQQPPIAFEGIVLDGTLAPDSLGVVRGSGGFNAAHFKLGLVDSGPASGVFTVRFVAADALPPPPSLPAPGGQP